MTTDQDIIHTAHPGPSALLNGRDNRTSIIRLEPGAEFHTHRGTTARDDLIESARGTEAKTHLGHPRGLLQPSADDLLRDLVRSPQIVYPTDAWYIMTERRVVPGCRVGEAGNGSGRLTASPAQPGRPDGQVISYGRRRKGQRLAQNNIELLGPTPHVVFRHGDIADGSEVHGEAADFGSVEVEELLLRPSRYSTVASRMRPKDRQAPDTGYLVSARKLIS